MKTKKIIAKIQEKIAYYELVVIGYKNDGDIECVNSTKQIITGLRESIDIIHKLKDKPKPPTKAVIKEAGTFLSIDEISIVEMVNLIIIEYNKGNQSDMIDWIDGVQVAELYESRFTTTEFLDMVGFDTELETINLLK
jgi:hypothetical protein